MEERLIAGRYRVKTLLGRGGGGRVYLVRDALQGNRLLALKLVSVPEAEDSSLLADLKNEFSTLSLLRHANLAQVQDFGITNEEMYFTSEWVEGKNLVATSEVMDFNTIFGLIVQCLRAVDFIHRRGVLHLDLKPANILVTDPEATGELTVRLIDFGIAQWKRHGCVQEADFFGTPPFAAPEIISGQEPSPLCDIYSLGMIFHLIFAKRFPFPSQAPFEILKRQIYEDPQYLGKIHPALPEGFSRLLHRMVARNPAERPSSPREILAELNACLGETFSLRETTAPIHILEESDYFFHPELINRLVSELKKGEGKVLGILGKKGSGKTRLLHQVKATLQLQGIRSFYFTEADGAEIFPQALRWQTPVLMDGGEVLSPQVKEYLMTETIHFPLVVAMENIPADSSLFLDEVIPIPSLGATSLSRFFREEIRQIPENFSEWTLESLGEVFPATLEKLLQASREENLLAWGEEGWRWQGKGLPDLKNIQNRYRERWEGRKRSVHEILVTSRLTLPAASLEGLLGIEPGSLVESLDAWCGEGILQDRWEEGVRCFHASGSEEGKTPSPGWGSNPEWLLAQLKSLYQEGKYSVGVAWAEILEKQTAEPRDPRVALHAARHWVAEGYGQKALEWLPAELPEDPQDRGLYLEIKARSFHLLGRWNEALQELSDSLQAYQEAEDGAGMGRVFNLRGTIAKGEARMVDAEKYYREAIHIARRSGDLYCAGTAQTNLALAYQEQGKIDRALSAYQSAWEYCRGVIHPRLTQALYHNWINLLHHMGRSAEAEKSCYEWLNLAIQHRFLEQQAMALNYLALFVGQKNFREQQASFLNQAIALLNSKKSPRLLAQLLANRALLYWSQDQFPLSQKDAEAALKLCAHWKDDPLQAWIFLVLGKVFRDRPQPDYEEASRYLELAERNATKNQTRQLLWEIKFNRGKLAKLTGDLPMARDHFLQAQIALEDLEKSLPAAFKESYLRDRKSDRVRWELENLKPRESLELPESFSLRVGSL